MIAAAAALVSCALIAFQVALMQALSIAQWYHFAGLVISVALLGFGAAGSILAAFRQSLLQGRAAWPKPPLASAQPRAKPGRRVPRSGTSRAPAPLERGARPTAYDVKPMVDQPTARADLVIAITLLLCGISMALGLPLAQTAAARFDLYLLFVERGQAARLALTCAIFFAPFFFGALALAVIFTSRIGQIGRLYGANLLGSALGGVAALAGLQGLAPTALPAA
ncbi:MAG: hypothetical protein KJ726_08990, partial [Verrucomicrobia bacterium]|nr:hypothetical protein [Verrucomicrobiota bacterium]